jgi:hypothetical protein
MDEPVVGTAVYTVCVCVTARVTGGFNSVNDLERAIVEATRAAGRELYAQGFAAFQAAWLQARSRRLTAQRWRAIDWLTPFGLLALPVRVVREKASGRYFTLSPILFRPKATRLLSPALEQYAVAEATAQNYRPAARSLSRWIGQRLGHWLVWAAVQFHGARRLLELEKLSPPAIDRLKVPALISEIDSTWLKSQQRHRPARSVRHFPVYLGLHYTGRVRRYAAGDSRSVRLENKTLLASTSPLSRFGRAFQLLALRRFCPQQHLLLSDGDEGLKWRRANYFPHTLWLLDRWHLAQAVRAFVANDQAQFHRRMAPIWQADSEAALEALRTSPLRRQRPKEFHALFGYVLGNREGIDTWQRVPPTLRRSAGRSIAAVKCGSGAVEKNIEVIINRRFKRQGRSWNPQRAERLLQLKLLGADERRWTNWWHAKTKFITKPNPP